MTTPLTALQRGMNLIRGARSDRPVALNYDEAVALYTAAQDGQKLAVGPDLMTADHAKLVAEMRGVWIDPKYDEARQVIDYLEVKLQVLDGGLEPH